jgi:release factor glutamine methyltransferase
VRDRFRAAGLDTPGIDARLLAERAFELSGGALLARETAVASADTLARLQDFAQRRLGGEPVARILGDWEFYGLRLTLVPEALVPRPETEMLVDFALSVLPRSTPAQVLDLGAGSGAIGIAVLCDRPPAQAVATEISPGAAACAAHNAAALGVADRYEARVGSWFAPLRADERFELILSNPPYIETAVIPTLAPEVREHDPVQALDGGPDGLDAYRVIAAGAAAHLKAGGHIAVEIGAGQGEAVTSLFTANGLATLPVKKDLAGLDRIVIAHHV